MIENVSTYLPDIWLTLIGFFLLYYAVADGFDLGVGILSLFMRDEDERGLMMASLESIWHDNQTWLALLGGMVFGAFPLFYSIVLSSLYVPIVIMLFGLILRGVSFEFRANSPNKRLWSLVFGLGSLVTAAAQGSALGGLLSGLQVEKGCFVGSIWGWCNPFGALGAMGVIAGYTMLGANYLIMKMEGGLHERAYRYSFAASLFTLVISILVHSALVTTHPAVAHKWQTFRLPDSLWLAFFPALAVIAFAMYYWSLWKRQHAGPFIWNAAIILFSFTAVSVALYPDMIPNLISTPVTVQEAAASPKTLEFMTVVIGMLLPIILIYTVMKHRIFWGKARMEHYGEEE